MLADYSIAVFKFALAKLKSLLENLKVFQGHITSENVEVVF